MTTNSSPVVSNATYEMVSVGSSSAESSSGTGMTTGGYYGNAIGDYYYPGYYPNYTPWTNWYTCSKCGALVCGYHNCTPPVTVISYPVYIPAVNPIDTKALEDKLDELTEEIKRLRKQTKKQLEKD